MAMKRPAMESDLGRVVDTLPGLVWTAFPDGQLDYLNHRWSECTGLGVEESRGQGWQTAIHPEDLPRLLASLRPETGSSASVDTEARLRGPDGTYRWFLFRAHPSADASGQVVKWCGLSTDIHERMQAEQALQASARRFRLIIDGLPVLLSTATPDGELDQANRHYLEYFGATLGELKARGVVHGLHPDDRDRVLAVRQAAIDAGRPYEIECRRRRADGVYRWFHLRAIPLHDQEGHIAQWYRLQIDIEEQKKAEALLAGEKRLLEMVASGRPMSVTLEALCRLVEDTSRGSCCSVVLVDPSGTRLQETIAPSLPAELKDALRDWPLQRLGGPCQTAARDNVQVIAPDVASDTRWRNSWRALAGKHGLRSCWSTPVVSQAGTVLGTFALYQREPGSPSPLQVELIEQFTDIASIAIERARRDAALRESEAFLVKAQRLSLTGSFSFYSAAEEFKWSEELYRIFEFQPGARVTLKLIESRYHPEDRHQLETVTGGIRRGEPDLDYEHRLLMPDGTFKHVHVVAHGTKCREGKGLEYFGAVQDITQRRVAEAALEKARSELAQVTRAMSLGALTASIAHEVNQPLAGIITNASTCLRMLITDQPNIKGAQETAHRTIRDANRAAEVIMRLRALVSKRAAATETLDLNEVAREVLALVSSDLLHNRVFLRAELDEGHPLLITGDRVQLQQVILNLVRNASDAMRDVNDRRRDLLVKAKREEAGGAHLIVKDAGVGLDPQTVGRLFEAFYTTKTDGMGIGLLVSRTIIESHGGKLWAEANVGPGATFSFSIPRFLDSVSSDRIGDAMQTAKTSSRPM